MARERITLLKIPVDLLKPEDIEAEIVSLLETDGPKHIVFLTVWDILKARSNVEYKMMIQTANLIIPVSRSILSGISFLKLVPPEQLRYISKTRYNPFNFIITVLSILESRLKSLYLFGSRKKSVHIAEKNVKETFPLMHVVGRCVGFYPKQVETKIISAIQKATPSLVLVSSGIHGKRMWIYRNKHKFNTSIFLWNNEVIDVFAKRKNRMPESVFNKGLEIWVEILKNPFKIFLLFPFVWFLFLLLVYRIFKLSK